MTEEDYFLLFLGAVEANSAFLSAFQSEVSDDLNTVRRDHTRLLIGLAFALHDDATRNTILVAADRTSALQFAVNVDRCDTSPVAPMDMERAVNEIEGYYMQSQAQIEAMIAAGKFSDVQVRILRNRILEVTIPER